MEIIGKDNWQAQFEKWKEEKKRRGAAKEKIIEEKTNRTEEKEDKHNKDVGIIKEVTEKLEKIEGKAYELIAEPKKIKIIKILIILIPLIIIGYITYNNFIISQEFKYFYDIGSEKDNFLSPNYRISDKIIVNETADYRNLTGHLVYFNVPIIRGSETIKIEAKFYDNFPDKNRFIIGAKDQDIWHYKWNEVYLKNISFKGEWMIVNTSFNLNETYIKDNKLSCVLSIPHLAPNKNETLNYTIPIDWIKITVHKPGVFEKIEK